MMTEYDIQRLQTLVRKRANQWNWQLTAFWLCYGAILGTLLGVGVVRAIGR